VPIAFTADEPRFEIDPANRVFSLNGWYDDLGGCAFLATLGRGVGVEVNIANSSDFVTGVG